MRSSTAFIILNTIISYSNNIAFSFTAAPRRNNVNFITKSNTKLYNVISGIKETDLADERGGGVGLAIDNAIKIVGSVTYKPCKKGGNNDEPSLNITPTDLLRYTKLTSVDNVDMNNVVCYGAGKELYKAPTEENPYTKEVSYAPVEAAKDAITKATSLSLSDESNDSLIINILGGEELMLNEALDAVFIIVNNLLVESADNISHIKNISFNSLCDKNIDVTTATVSVITASKAADQDHAAELYSYNGKWLTVLKEHLNTDKK